MKKILIAVTTWLGKHPALGTIILTAPFWIFGKHHSLITLFLEARP